VASKSKKCFARAQKPTVDIALCESQSQGYVIVVVVVVTVFLACLFVFLLGGGGGRGAVVVPGRRGSWHFE